MKGMCKYECDVREERRGREVDGEMEEGWW